MKNFEILKLNNLHYSHLIIAKSYENPLDELYLIEKELQCDFPTKVVFDLLFVNGNSFNRFIEATYRNNKFDINSIKIAPNIDSEIISQSTSFYQNNLDLLEYSILSDSYKFMLNTGRM